MCGCPPLQVHLGAVQLGNTAVINEIRSLEPYTISWSNVPDYIHPADFHKLAHQAISAPSDTVHFMHRCASRACMLHMRVALASHACTALHACRVAGRVQLSVMRLCAR